MVNTAFVDNKNPPVGASLLAMAVHLPAGKSNAPPRLERASSPHLIAHHSLATVLIVTGRQVPDTRTHCPIRLLEFCHE
jgi:hypothetical protein